MAVLAALNLWWGAWARFWPEHFFAEFPGFGHRWTAAYPPFNRHLVTDLGATFLTLGFLVAVAALLADRRLRVVALSTVVVFNALHLGFHVGNPGTLVGIDLGASLATLVAGVLAPIALMAGDGVGRRRERRSLAAPASPVQR